MEYPPPPPKLVIKIIRNPIPSVCVWGGGGAFASHFTIPGSTTHTVQQCLDPTLLPSQLVTVFNQSHLKDHRDPTPILGFRLVDAETTIHRFDAWYKEVEGKKFSIQNVMILTEGLDIDLNVFLHSRKRKMKVCFRPYICITWYFVLS